MRVAHAEEYEGVDGLGQTEYWVDTPGGPLEILRQAGAAEFPEGTIRQRRGPFFVSRRG